MGPIDYTYENLKIFLASECMYDHSFNLGYDLSTGLGYLIDETGIVPGFDNKKYDGLNTKFYKELNLSVEFIEPCSPVDIGFPLQDFVVTPAAENKLSITLNEYNKNDEDLKLIRLQYRPVGGDGSWINISETLKADLGDVFTLKEWNTELLKDGVYDIRAVAECFSPTLVPGISTVIRGTLERLPPVVIGVPQPGDGTWDPGDEISITFNEPIDCDKVVQADILANNTIGLYDATTNALVDATITCVGNKIVIVPNINPVFFENRTFRVNISGKDYDDALIAENPNHQRAAIRDKAGNMIEKSIIWEFAVNQNNLEWVGTDIIETNEVLKAFSVKRQIRNRGGSIASFRMESVPSWLTVSPATGTLNPGQVADVTFTFQQDLLIGDYLDTVNMVGSRGAEPLLVDYRVRCPQPPYEVVNPEQYEGTMNMVIDLSIFGVTSTDPSDVIVAKIDGQIRGVGRVNYYRNIPADKQRWLTFLTVYGNSSDEDKPLEFSIWDGDKCNEYVEVLESYTYKDGALEGSPIVPTPVSVLNLVKKCIPLNKGFNWVSFNLNLGANRNTVENMMSSLKSKSGVYLKTFDSFAEYYEGYGWDALDTLIYPTKRYMVYTPQVDTVCIKGAPYLSAQYPVNIKTGWNWIGYVPSTGMTVTQALKGLTPLNGDIIKSQTSFAQFVAGVGWIGNLNFMEPLKGYLLKISNAGSLIYPSANGVSTTTVKGEIGNKIQAEALKSESPATFEYTQYASTMNVIGKINGMSVTVDDELRAYVDGQLVGQNKGMTVNKDILFFHTIYHEEKAKVDFKFWKADRNKEYELDKNVVFAEETVAGMVQEPIVFNVMNSATIPVTFEIQDQFISKPQTQWNEVSVANAIPEGSVICSAYSFSTVLPQAEESRPECVTTTLEGNMTSVIKVVFNERSSFVSENDVLMFIDAANESVVGCGTFNSTNKYFYSTIAGSTGSATRPLDVIYYSSAMKKNFRLKSAVNYVYNSRLGSVAQPHVVDLSPVHFNMDDAGNITASLIDTTWTGGIGINVFASNFNCYNDGQATYTYYRLKQNPGGITVSPSNAYVCPGAIDTLVAQGCNGQVSWLGVQANILSADSAAISTTQDASYTAICSNGDYTTGTVKVAVTNTSLNSILPTGSDKVKAVETIRSTAKLGNNQPPGANVIYEAGNAIILEPGFTAEKWSVFKAEIKTCNQLK